MDKLNRFHTRGTYSLVRLDYVALALFTAIILARHSEQIAWLRFVIAFWWIDVLGYIPGAIWYQTRAKKGARAMPSAFVVLYDLAHSAALNLTLIVAWYSVLGRFEWAMLAAPLHLCIDRGVFGNIYKTHKLSFEPIAHAAFSAFSLALERGGDWPGTGSSTEPNHKNLDKVEDLVRRFSDHPSIGLVFNREMEHFTVAGVDAFLAYRQRGKTLFCVGGPVGPEPAREALLQAFLARAKQDSCRVIALQVRQADVALFHAHGFRVNQMGSSFTLSLSDFSLKGSRFMKLRNKVKQPQKSGVTIRELTQTGMPRDAFVQQLDEVSAAWLQAKGSHVKELRFLVGEIDSLQREETRCFAALRGEEVIAFITYVPCYGRFTGYMHDLTRKKPDCPPGTLEAVNLCAIEAFRAEGIGYLSFGFTPLVGIEDSHPSHSRVVSRLLRFMAQRADFIYPAQSQEAYKKKWYPQFVEPEYLAFQGKFALTQLWSFLRLTRSI
jgi:lysylphosphatidylglycerol synthetase-like protein (DUF2156 family)